MARAMTRLLISLVSVCLLAPAAAADTPYTLAQDFAKLKLSRPVALAVAPDGSQRLFLAQQTGKVLVLPKDRAGAEAKVFLDVSGLMKVENDFEEGLVGFAFHPKYKENGRFYVCYAQQDPKINRLSEFKVSADPDKADAASERVVLEVPRPFWNHNSGNMVFGPDGMLYFTVGDGGKGDDAARLSQVQFTMNGKLLRLDVDGRTGRRQYGIPADNPFVKTDGACKEAWAWGLRNPWGLAFDSETGALWCADVGQEQREEINVIVKGGNYGWSFREGTLPFVRRRHDPPADAKFIEPVHEYDRSQGISITGGFVYRGQKHTDLRGAYIYGDWGSGRVWALKTEGPDHKVASNTLLIEPAPGQAKFAKPAAFCEDESREILLLDWNGAIHRLEKR
jgi:glucose/arabinose dehydrogenase